MDEDTKIEFKDCDHRVFGEMVGWETSKIANLRRELSKSTKRIKEADDIIKELVEVLERSRRLLENTSHDCKDPRGVREGA